MCGWSSVVSCCVQHVSKIPSQLPCMVGIHAVCIQPASSCPLVLKCIVCARRDMNLYDNARGARVTDALLNYETVKVFGNEEYEWNALDECIVKYQDVEYKLMASLNGLNVLQSIIIFSGLIAGLMVCVKVSSRALYHHGIPVLFIFA